MPSVGMRVMISSERQKKRKSPPNILSIGRASCSDYCADVSDVTFCAQSWDSSREL